MNLLCFCFLALIEFKILEEENINWIQDSEEENINWIQDSEVGIFFFSLVDKILKIPQFLNQL